MPDDDASSVRKLTDSFVAAQAPQTARNLLAIANGKENLESARVHAVKMLHQYTAYREVQDFFDEREKAREKERLKLESEARTELEESTCPTKTDSERNADEVEKARVEQADAEIDAEIQRMKDAGLVKKQQQEGR